MMGRVECDERHADCERYNRYCLSLTITISRNDGARTITAGTRSPSSPVHLIIYPRKTRFFTSCVCSIGHDQAKERLKVLVLKYSKQSKRKRGGDSGQTHLHTDMIVSRPDNPLKPTIAFLLVLNCSGCCFCGVLPGGECSLQWR